MMNDVYGSVILFVDCCVCLAKFMLLCMHAFSLGWIAKLPIAQVVSFTLSWRSVYVDVGM